MRADARDGDLTRGLYPGLYDQLAAEYDRDRDRSLVEKSWLDRFLTLIGPEGTVLDLGCGMGEPMARYIMEAGHDVVGLDSAVAMIARCRARFPNQRWLAGDMRNAPLARAFDGVLAWDSFFHLPGDDQRMMFEEFARYCGPGAPLMFTSGTALGESVGSYHEIPLYHASLDAEEYRQLLEKNGFDTVRHQERDVNCGDHTVWLARRRSS